jgi:acetyltransferase-like isoleucine patch superfamily enzyme
MSSLLQLWYYRKVWGMTLGSDLRISRSAKLDKTNPKGIHVGDATLISFEAAVLTHDFVSNRFVDTFIGSHCFIGARTIIMPGVRIGDHCIIGSGSVVLSDVPPNSIAVGNPARVVKSGITTGRWGIRDREFLEKEGILSEDPGDTVQHPS